MTHDNLPSLIFVHVPKTAGTTFTKTVLEPLYKDSILLDNTALKGISTKKKHLLFQKNQIVYRFNDSLPKNYIQYKVIRGHILYTKYMHMNYQNITFLRDPVERIISHYDHLKRAGWIKDVSIVEFSKLYANMYSRQLGDLAFLDFIGITEHYNLSVERFCLKYDINVDMTSHSIFRKARKKSKITKRIKNIIRDHNKEDCELYNKVLKDFI